MEQILEYINRIEVLLLLLVPAAVAAGVKIKNKIKREAEILKIAESKKAGEIYMAWEHIESRRIISKIKELCNLYRDRSHSDQVLYMQFENGTTATSKLSNMFISCVAEDDRYGEISKKISELQHIPYYLVAEWAEEAMEETFALSDIKAQRENWDFPIIDDAASHISSPVNNKNGNFIGIVIFNYKARHYNGAPKENQLKLINECKTAIETIFLTYYIAQKKKMTELKLDT